MSLRCRFKYLLRQAIRIEHQRHSRSIPRDWKTLSVLWSSSHTAIAASRLFRTTRNKGSRMRTQRPRFEILRIRSYRATTLPPSSSKTLFHTLRRRRLIRRHRMRILTDLILRQTLKRHPQTPPRCHLTNKPLTQMEPC